MHEEGIFDFTISNDFLPAGLGIQLTTDFFEQYFPGFIKRYGEGENVDVRIKTYAAPQALIGGGKIGGVAAFDMYLICKGEDALIGRVDNGEIKVSVKFEDFKLTIQATDF